MIPSDKDRGRAQELLADRATEGVGPDGEAELRAILGPQWAASRDAIDGYEIAAAAIHLSALRGRTEPMPAHLARAIEERALGPRHVSEPAARPLGESQPQRSMRVIPIPTRRPLIVRAAPWLAAAACFALAVTAWVLRPPRQTTLASTFDVKVPITIPSASTPLDPVAARAELLRTAPDATVVAWSAGKDPADAQASGDVVWSDAQQRGFMRFRNVQTNDPKTMQYQLWIFDTARDDHFPVDGGVFDVGGGEVIVPIRSKLPVTRAKLFAVTAEKPGGVVVSKRERLVVTAAVKTG